MRRDDIERIKKQSQKEKKDFGAKFYNDLVVPCFNVDTDVITIYKILKIKNMEQMLSVMPKTTIKQYNLHVPTLIKLHSLEICNNLNKVLEAKGYKFKLSPLQLDKNDLE